MEELRIYGSCCACTKNAWLRTIVLLEKKAPIAGAGWACIQCGLSAEGAIALICDPCAVRLAKTVNAAGEILFACAGRAFEPERIPIARLQGEHKHDQSKHPELESTTCRLCGCTDDRPCVDGAGEVCFWVTPNLCSACAENFIPEALVV